MNTPKDTPSRTRPETGRQTGPAAGSTHPAPPPDTGQTEADIPQRSIKHYQIGGAVVVIAVVVVLALLFFGPWRQSAPEPGQPTSDQAVPAKAGM